MAALATSLTAAGLAALRPSRRSLGVRGEPGAAVAREGLRAAGRATRSASGVPRRCPASYGQSMRRLRDSGLVARRFCMSVASPRGAQPAAARHPGTGEQAFDSHKERKNYKPREVSRIK